jgi:hypothetical protein
VGCPEGDARGAARFFGGWPTPSGCGSGRDWRVVAAVGRLGTPRTRDPDHPPPVIHGGDQVRNPRSMPTAEVPTKPAREPPPLVEHEGWEPHARARRQTARTSGRPARAGGKLEEPAAAIPSTALRATSEARLTSRLAPAATGPQAQLRSVDPLGLRPHPLPSRQKGRKTRGSLMNCPRKSTGVQQILEGQGASNPHRS